MNTTITVATLLTDIYPDSSKTREKFLVFFGLGDSARHMIRGGFLTEEDRGKLVALVRDGSAASRVTRRANALVGPHLPPRSRSRIGGDGGAHDGGGGDHRSGGHAGARVAVRDRDRLARPVLRRQRAPYVRLSGRAASAAVAIAHRWATYCAWAMISLHR